MKRSILFLMAALMAFDLSVAQAGPQRGTPEYEKLAAYKKAQFAERQAEKEAEAKGTPSTAKKPGFWQKEAERSGFAGTGAMFGNAISSVVPLDKPNSRKSS